MNSIIITGNLTRDPEVRSLTSGTTVVTMSVAVRRTYKNKQTGQYDSDFFNVGVFGKTAEFISGRAVKGDKVAVSGSIQSRKYTDKQGVERTVWEISASNVELLSSKPKTDAQTGFNEVDDDVLPWMDGV